VKCTTSLNQKNPQNGEKSHQKKLTFFDRMKMKLNISPGEGFPLKSI